jgi:hypothetical protein
LFKEDLWGSVLELSSSGFRERASVSSADNDVLWTAMSERGD